MQIIKRNISYLYVFIINFFLKIYYLWVPFQPVPVVPTILTMTEDYVETKKKRFLMIEQQNNNCNIDAVFYDKKEYQEVMQITDNWLEKTWKMRILFESSPRGNIIMFYNPYKLGFAYYSDSYNLPYHLLNAVAMKYVTVYFCRDFFMDENIIPSPLIKIHAEQQTKKKKSKIDNTTVKMIQTRSSKQLSNSNNSKEISKNKPEQNVNRFINMGKIANFVFIQKEKPASCLNGFASNFLDNLSGEISLQKKVMDYKAFKSMRSCT
jgi:hypothetical protein